MAHDTPEKVDFRIRYWFLTDGMFQATRTNDIRFYRLPDLTQEMARYATKEFATMVAATRPRSSASPFISRPLTTATSSRRS